MKPVGQLVECHWAPIVESLGWEELVKSLLVYRLVASSVAAAVIGVSGAALAPRLSKSTQGSNSTYNAPAEASGSWYTVKSGDTLSRIARAFGVSTSELAKVNNLSNPDRILVGQRLWIPSSPSSTPPASEATAVPSAAPAAGTELEYVVQSGDTLSRIATRFGVSTRALAEANGISDINLITVGSRLRIPAAGAAQPTGLPAAETEPQPTKQASAADEGWYTVRSGESLGDIASRFGTTALKLAALNNLENPNLIHVGQRLRTEGAPAVSATSEPDPAAIAPTVTAARPTTPGLLARTMELA